MTDKVLQKFREIYKCDPSFNEYNQFEKNMPKRMDGFDKIKIKIDKPKENPWQIARDFEKKRSRERISKAMSYLHPLDKKLFAKDARKPEQVLERAQIIRYIIDTYELHIFEAVAALNQVLNEKRFDDSSVGWIYKKSGR